MLHPGGLVIIIVSDTDLIINNQFASEIAQFVGESRMTSWINF